MSDPYDAEEPPGIRVDQLQDGDRVLMFGRVIRVVTARPLDDSPGVLAMTIKTSDGGRVSDVVLRGDWKVIAVHAPRTVTLPCLLCQSAGPVAVNLAQSLPRRTVCRSCGGV
ncbi:hypothetical protein [Actinoplanes sp. NPDC049316]|uniref:hypothetical protein n=1 Tax=Actinoplanes sp. NPDC049316 TaxID=3154727 RepID=UPI003426A6DA